MRKVEKVVGTEFTRRKTTHLVAEKPEEIRDVVRQVRDWMEDPWADHRREVEAARAALAREIAAKPESYRFREHEDTGWYLERLVTLGDLVQHHIEAGASAWAAHKAALFGEVFCELEMKAKREREWITGQKVHAGSDASRRGDQAERVKTIEALCTGPDRISKRKAFEVVGNRESVSAKAVEIDYYKARKRPKPGD